MIRHDQRRGSTLHAPSDVLPSLFVKLVSVNLPNRCMSPRSRAACEDAIPVSQAVGSLASACCLRRPVMATSPECDVEVKEAVRRINGWIRRGEADFYLMSSMSSGLRLIDADDPLRRSSSSTTRYFTAVHGSSPTAIIYDPQYLFNVISWNWVEAPQRFDALSTCQAVHIIISDTFRWPTQTQESPTPCFSRQGTPRERCSVPAASLSVYFGSLVSWSL
jgi:hypothetical protein